MSNYNKDDKDYQNLVNENFPNYLRLLEGRGAPEDGKANHPFFYPGANPPHINNKLGEENSVFKNLPKMRRGFMRSILFGQTSVGKNDTPLTVVNTKATGNVRLNFQFNPEYIERNVAQSQGAVNPLLQNPANLTQPVPGTASFNFTMTFNREYEVAHRDRDLRFRFMDSERGDVFSSTTNDFTNMSMLGELSDPRYSGVLHDLSIFDKIIGQGISQDVIDTITSFNKKIFEIQQASQANSTNTNNNNNVQYLKDDDFKDDVFKKVLENKNFGNSAFINPLPVRIVFGDLFMVEGFVTGSAVAFQKFSQQMIPTICQVNCTVQALYFGFAKRKAFLTDSLADWYKSTITTPSASTPQILTTANQQLQDIVHVGMLWNSAGDNYGKPFPRDDKYTLIMPDENADITKVLVPVNTWDGKNPKQLRYAGNIKQFTKRYLTLPQWFNSFSQTQKQPLPSSAIKHDVGNGVSRTMIDMLQTNLPGQGNNGVLSKQLKHFNDVDWLTVSQFTTNLYLYGYTPLVVCFRVKNPLVDPSGTLRQKDFPNKDFSSIFKFYLDRITVAAYGPPKSARVEKLIEVLQIDYLDTEHWSSWYRQWRKNEHSDPWNMSDKFDSPLHRYGAMPKWDAKKNGEATDFVKIYWVRPKYTEKNWLADQIVYGLNTTYELSYYFKIEVNTVTYNVTPLKHSIKNNEPFIRALEDADRIKTAANITSWRSPRFKVM
jgi:hypothetical protein